MTTTAAQTGYTHLAEVHFDELDPMGLLHNSRYSLLFERALTAFWPATDTPLWRVVRPLRTRSTWSAARASPTTDRYAASARWPCTSGSTTSASRAGTTGSS